MVTACLFPTAARAQAEANEALARREFETAEREFMRDNYALSLRGFQRTYELMEGHPRRALVLFNIGRCFEELGRHQDAADAYRRFLQDAGAEAPQREETEARLRELETRVSLAAGDESQSSPASSLGRSEPSGGGLSPVGPAILGVGGAMLLIGAGTGVAATLSRSDFTAMCVDMLCPESARELRSDVENLALATDVLLFGGAIVAAIGLVLTLVLTDGPSGDTAAAFTCTDMGCMAFLAGEIE